MVPQFGQGMNFSPPSALVSSADPAGACSSVAPSSGGASSGAAPLAGAAVGPRRRMSMNPTITRTTTTMITMRIHHGNPPEGADVLNGANALQSLSDPPARAVTQ